MPHETFNISQVVRDSYPFLRQLAKTKSHQKRKRLLRRATTSDLLSITEICLNIIRNRFRLTTRQRQRMLPYADFIRRVGRARTERGAHKLIVQKGNGLPIAIFSALLTPIITELARYAINKFSS
jgi:hypothetical protein